MAKEKKPVVNMEDPILVEGNELKQKLKLIPTPQPDAPPMVPQPVVTQPVAPAAPAERVGVMPQTVLDYEAMDPYRKKLDDKSNFRALLVGATPLLTGFLAGNMGDAYEIASKGLITEDLRRQKEEGTLLDLLKLQKAADKKAAKSGGGSDPNVVVMDPETNFNYTIPRSVAQTPNLSLEEMRRYPRADKWEPIDQYGKRQGAAASARIGAGKEAGIYDKQVEGPQGQPMLRRPGEHTAIPIYMGTEPGDIKSQKQSTQVAKSVNDFQTQTAGMRDSLNIARQLKDLSKLKTTEADNFLTFQLPKLAGAGQLSDEERKAFTGGGGSIQDWIKVQSTKKTKGLFPDHIRTRMIKLADMLAKRIEDRYNRTRKGHIDTQSKMFKMDPAIYESYLMKENTGSDTSPSGFDPKKEARIIELKKKLGKK